MNDYVSHLKTTIWMGGCHSMKECNCCENMTEKLAITQLTMYVGSELHGEILIGQQTKEDTLLMQEGYTQVLLL